MRTLDQIPHEATWREQTWLDAVRIAATAGALLILLAAAAVIGTAFVPVILTLGLIDRLERRRYRPVRLPHS